MFFVCGKCPICELQFLRVIDFYIWLKIWISKLNLGLNLKENFSQLIMIKGITFIDISEATWSMIHLSYRRKLWGGGRVNRTTSPSVGSSSIEMLDQSARYIYWKYHDVYELKLCLKSITSINIWWSPNEWISTKYWIPKIIELKIYMPCLQYNPFLLLVLHKCNLKLH